MFFYLVLLIVMILVQFKQKLHQSYLNKLEYS